MRVLFLDDDQTRHKYFREWCAEANIVPDCVFTADSAADALEKTYYDICFLDHDLAEVHYGAMGELPGDGTALAKWMADNKKHVPSTVVVHSYNPDGAKRMVDLLSEDHRVVIWNPFGPGLKRFLA